MELTEWNAFYLVKEKEREKAERRAKDRR